MELNTKIIKGAWLNNTIINHIYFGKCLSCAELNKILDKNVLSTSKTTNKLINEGFVVEPYTPYSGEYLPLMHVLSPQAMYIVKIAIDQLSIENDSSPITLAEQQPSIPRAHKKVKASMLTVVEKAISGIKKYIYPVLNIQLHTIWSLETSAIMETANNNYRFCYRAIIGADYK